MEAAGAQLVEGTPILVAVSASDPDGDAIASLTSSGLPAGASFTPAAGNSWGALHWTPGAGQAGEYQVGFTAANTLSGSAATILTARVPGG